MEGEARNLFNDNENKMNMTIPERIVLSAGYDGTDNEELSAYRSPRGSAFDEPPLVNPDEVMAGMHTPPSVLTIDHESSYNDRKQRSHETGDGADTNDSESSLLHAASSSRHLDDEAEYTSVMSPQRSAVIAGQEDHYEPLDDPLTLQRYYASMQRRVAILENELEYQQRVANVWKYLLLTLTVVNPLILNFFFGRRR